MSITPSLLSALLALSAADPATTGPDAKTAEGGEGVVVERIVAIVDKDIILLSEVESVVDQMLQAEPPPPGADRAAWMASRRQEILDTLVAEKLLEGQIKKLRIEVTEPEIERVIQSTMAQHGLNQAQLEQALAQQGLTFDEYREGLKKQLMKAKIIQLKVKSRVQVSDQEVKNQLASQRTKASRRFKVRARHMVFLVKDEADEAAARKKAEAALARVRNGEGFAEVAEAVSEGPSASKGGQLGVFGRGEMVPEFEEAAFQAEPGDPVGPVRSPFGWHLILVEERVTLDVGVNTQAEERMRQALYEQATERAFQRYIEELKQKAYIEMRPQAFVR